MKKDKEWLKEEMYSMYPSYNEIYVRPDDETAVKVQIIDEVLELIDQLDEPEKTYADGYTKGIEHTLKNLDRHKPAIPQFVADWIERQRKYEPEPVITAMNRLRTHGTRELIVWFESNPDLYARAWLDGYEVEKEILWEIPMPNLKTSAGNIQYLTYDPKARTYFAATKNERLKQTFNTKDFASVPEQYRRYAVLCGFKKIQEETE